MNIKEFITNKNASEFHTTSSPTEILNCLTEKGYTWMVWRFQSNSLTFRVYDPCLSDSLPDLELYVDNMNFRCTLRKNELYLGDE